MSELNNILKELNLGIIKNYYEQAANKARKENICYEDFLYEVCKAEIEIRRKRKIEKLIKQSKLPLGKTLENFDRKRLPSKINASLSLILKGDFVSNKENILIFGNPGSGKTHLASAILYEMIL